MSQANCSFCGSPLAPNDKACQFCGQPIPGDASPAPEVPDSYVAPVEPYQAPVPAAPPEPAYSSPPGDNYSGSSPAAHKSASPMRAILIAVIILVVLCCCAIVIFWAFFSNMELNIGLQIFRQALLEMSALAV